MPAIALVYRTGWSIPLALISFAAMAILYLWSSQVLVISGSGISVLVEPQFIAAALLMASLFGFLLPLEVYAFRLAAATATQTGGTVLGAIAGTTSMTCCAPVILPSLLSVIGFSGTSILSINTVLGKYWLPLATASVILLSYSIFSVVQSLNLECKLTASMQEQEV